MVLTEKLFLSHGVKFRLRPMLPSDAESLAVIERESFADACWLAQDFLRYDCVLAEVTSPTLELIAGFLVSHQTFAGDEQAPPEREILNLAVARSFRRLGVASALLAHERRRQATLFLEVRESNLPAIHVYQNAGFREVAQRRDYYQNPVESAIVMRMKWC